MTGHECGRDCCAKILGGHLTNMTINELLLPEFENETEKTRKLLERVPFDDPDWKPHEKSMVIGRLAGHIAELPSWANDTVALESLNIEPGFKAFFPRSSEELLKRFDAKVASARTAIAGASDEHLQKVWTLSFDGKPVLSMPRHSILRNLVMNHLIHHRGQLSVYLRLRNVAVPGMYGPSADEKP
jgi:uncharacterized damage-inducible protein DinB